MVINNSQMIQLWVLSSAVKAVLRFVPGTVNEFALKFVFSAPALGCPIAVMLAAQQLGLMELQGLGIAGQRFGGGIKTLQGTAAKVRASKR